MPTDETTLAALERLAERYERQAAHHARDAHDFAESPVPVLRLTAPDLAKQTAENALIADALRCKLASLTAPAAQDTAEMLALLDGADGSGCGPDDTFTLYLPLHRARRLHALVTARIAHDEEARSAASLPRGGADV